MPHEFTFEMLPMGHALQAARKGEQVTVGHSAFLSSENGQAFIQGLEGFPNELLCRLPSERKVEPWQVNNLLAIIRRDKSAVLYVNELDFVVQMVPARDIAEGEPVMRDDIVDVIALQIKEIEIPEDCGFVFVFSIGWRKGLLYDLGPLNPKKDIRREAHLPTLFGQCYTSVMFQERLSASDAEWEVLFKAKWFLFAGLRSTTLASMRSHVNAGWELDDMIPQISAEVKERLPSFVRCWKGHPAFADHVRTFEAAAQHFESGDFLSASSLLFPRIEGVMRSYHAAIGSTTKPTQKSLPRTAVQDKIALFASLLLPQRFEQYLKEVFFADFDPRDPHIEPGRNSVGHGVVMEEKLNEKAAIIAILVAQHLYYCFKRPSEEGAQPVTLTGPEKLPTASSQDAPESTTEADNP